MLRHLSSDARKILTETAFLGVLFLAIFGPVAISGVSLTKQDIEAALLVSFDQEERTQILEIDSRYRIEIIDRNDDGTPDFWKLYDNDTLKCERWSRSLEGAPDAGELYDDSGKSLGSVVWGHYREVEAEQIKQQMDKELSDQH